MWCKRIREKRAKQTTASSTILMNVGIASYMDDIHGIRSIAGWLLNDSSEPVELASMSYGEQ